jgi:hypothetical protein
MELDFRYSIIFVPELMLVLCFVGQREALLPRSPRGFEVDQA